MCFSMSNLSEDRFENSRLPSQLSNDLRKKMEKNLKRKKQQANKKKPLRRQLNTALIRDIRGKT